MCINSSLEFCYKGAQIKWGSSLWKVKKVKGNRVLKMRAGQQRFMMMCEKIREIRFSGVTFLSRLKNRGICIQMQDWLKVDYG